MSGWLRKYSPLSSCRSTYALTHMHLKPTYLQHGVCIALPVMIGTCMRFPARTHAANELQNSSDNPSSPPAAANKRVLC